MSNQESEPTCQLSNGACHEEALYHCNICKGKFCFEHVCVHLKQAQTLPLPDDDGIESSDQELRTISDTELRAKEQRLFQELKRIRRELDSRMIFAADYFRDEQRIRPALNYGHPFYADPKEDKRAAQIDKDKKKQAAEYKKLEDAIRLALGKVSAPELLRLIKK